MMFLRDNQNMGGRLRVDVAKGKRTGTLSNPNGGDITRDDLAEEAVCHVMILTCGSPERVPTYRVASLRTLGAPPWYMARQPTISARVPPGVTLGSAGHKPAAWIGEGGGIGEVRQPL